MLLIHRVKLRYTMQYKNTGKQEQLYKIQIFWNYSMSVSRLETTKLLLEHGANPYAISRHGDDALRTACLKGAHPIFDYLRNNLEYSIERLAEAHELIGLMKFVYLLQVDVCYKMYVLNFFV